jgi:hypothetical protein
MRSSPEPVRTTVKSSGALPCGSAASQRLTPQVACWRSLAAGSFPEVLRPTALAALPVHVTRALPARYVPSPGFGYPPDGFLPAEPRQPCFRLAALVGLALQRFLTTAVVQPRRLGRSDPWFPRLSVSRCEHRSGGRRRHLSGLPRSSARNEVRVVTPWPVRASPGLLLSGVVHRPAWPAGWQVSAHGLACGWSPEPHGAHSASQSPADCPGPLVACSRGRQAAPCGAAGPGSPSEVHPPSAFLKPKPQPVGEPDFWPGSQLPVTRSPSLPQTHQPDTRALPRCRRPAFRRPV